MNILKEIGTTVKNAIGMYIDAAKHFPVDTGVCIMAIFALIYWWCLPETDMAGGVAILAVYASGVMLRMNRLRKIIRDLTNMKSKS